MTKSYLLLARIRTHLLYDMMYADRPLKSIAYNEYLFISDLMKGILMKSRGL